MIRLTAALLLVGVWVTAAGQQSPTTEVVLTPDPRSLSEDWWTYIADAGDRLSERTQTLLAFATDAVRLRSANDGADNEETKQFLERLQLNLGALPEMQAQQGLAGDPIPASAPEYRLQEYIDIQRDMRRTRHAAEQLSQVITRAEQSADLADDRIDNLMSAYQALPEADPTRLRRGLQIMAARSGLAIAREQLRVRQANLAMLENRAEQLTLLLEQVSDAIVPSAEELRDIDTELAQLHEQLGKVQADLRDRQARALGAQGVTPVEQARAAWRELRIVEAATRERQITLEIAQRGLQQAWFAMTLATPEEIGPHLSTASQRLSELDDLLRLSRAELEEWEQQAERELNELRLTDNDQIEPQLRTVNQERLATANQTLRNITQARGVAEDAELIGELTRKRLSVEQGTVVGGASATWDWVTNLWQNVNGYLSKRLFGIADKKVTTLDLLHVAVIMFVAVWLSRLFRHALDRIGSRGEGTQSAFYTVGRLAHYVIIAAGILIALASIGLSFSNLAIVAGALGVGIGFGLQSIVNNFVSGLILLFERSLKVGDYVELESGVGGVVKEINVRSTLINTNVNLDVLVPNSEFVSGRLTNWTLKEASRRMHIPFGVAYGTDKELVRDAVLAAAESVSHTVKDNPLKRAEVWLVEFGDSSLNFELVIWIKQASVRRPSKVHATYTWAIETALGEAGIEIPFPQRDLHLRSGFPPPAADAGTGDSTGQAQHDDAESGNGRKG